MLLGVDVAGMLNAVAGREAQPATLTKITAGTRGATLSAGTNPTSVSYGARGWIEAYDIADIAGTAIEQNDRRITLLARSIAGGVGPTSNDKITIVDLDGVTKTFRVEGDVQSSGPQGAMWICQGRL